MPKGTHGIHGIIWDSPTLDNTIKNNFITDLYLIKLKPTLNDEGWIIWKLPGNQWSLKKAIESAKDVETLNEEWEKVKRWQLIILQVKMSCGLP